MCCPTWYHHSHVQQANILQCHGTSLRTYQQPLHPFSIQKKKKACLVQLLNTALTLSLFVLLLFGHLTAAAIAASLVTCFQACVLHISFYLFCFCFSLWHAFNTDYNEHLLFPVDFYEHSFAVFQNAALVWPFIFLVLLLALIDNLAF